MSWEYFSPQNPCPVCDGISSNCRKPRNSDITLCHYFIETESGTRGYKFIKPTADRIWGIHVRDNGEKEPWQQRIGKYNSKRDLTEIRSSVREKKTKRLKQSQFLSIEERSHHNHSLLQSLSLDDDHQKSLRVRGLSDSAIEDRQFRSLHDRSTLPDSISPKLAGVQQTNEGKFLRVSGRGVSCPAFSPLGLITGIQVRLDNTSKGKYRWLKWQFSSHLPNGEMPITCVTPTKLLHTDFIGLAEGILKPIVIAELHGITCMGASGGNFTSSRNQLKEYLSIVSDQQNTKRIVYFVDANAVANDQVYKRDCKTIKQLVDWGYEVTIADWGQLYERSTLDFDEYLAEGNNSYNLISAEEYLSLKDFQSFADLFKPIQQILRKKPSKSKGFENRLQQKPIFKFKQAERAKTIINLMEFGYKQIIDVSGTGTGKSTLIEQIEPVDQLFYVSSAHRNPTTAAAERIFDMPVRHDGMDFDYKRKTPLGNPYQVYSNRNRDPATADHISVREPDIASLCISADIFNSMRSKGYQPDDTDGKLNPICNACPKNISCANKIENGFGYRYARRTALKQKKLRISAESLPNPKEFDYSKVIVVVDEPSVTLRWTEKTPCTLVDFERSLTEVEMRDKELYDRLFPIKQILYNLFKEAKQKPYGIGDSEVRNALGNPPEDLADTIDFLETIVTKLTDLIEGQIDIKSVEKKWRSNANAANQIASTETLENLQNIHSNWLIPFLKVWAGIKNGALRITNRQVLTIATLNTRFAEIASSAKAVIYLDATIEPELLMTALNLNREQTAIIKQTTEIPKNLEIVQVTGFKKCLRERSDNLKQRIEAVKAKLATIHSGDVVFLDYKNMENIHGHWFNHSRGTNEWQNIGNIVALGTPNLNVGEIEDLYLCLYGTDNYDEKRFNSFYERFTQQEIIQAIGRLRAGNRCDRQLKFYFLSDFDLGFLENMGYQVTSVNSFEITPEAGDKTQVKTWGLITIAKSWFEAHGSLAKLTQKEVSVAIGCTQGYVSRLLQSIGGWKEFKNQVEKILLSLQGDIKSQSNIFESLENEELNYFREILKLPPIEAIKEIVDIIRNCGWDNFLNYLLSDWVIEVDRFRILGLVAAIFTNFTLGSEINVSSISTLLNS